MSIAERYLKKYGEAVAWNYIQRPADGAELYKCEKEHPDCANNKNGACLQELAQLLSKGGV